MTKALYRVTGAADIRVRGVRLSADGILLAHPDAVRYEVDCGHLAPTTVEAEARPIEGLPDNLTDAERAALPRLAPLGDGPIEYAVGISDVRTGDGADAPMVEVPMEPDGEGGFIGTLTETASEG